MQRDFAVDRIHSGSIVPIRYYLGIDGGGTKTAFLLEDRQGNAVASCTLGPSNPNDIGMEQSQALLESGIAEVCRGVDRREIALYAGIAGGISGDNQARFRDFFARFGFGRAANGSDMDNARGLTLQGKNGVATILGTGSIAYAQKDGVCKRIGGWGYLLDEGGSGYDLGRDALHAALCAVDGTGEHTALLPLLEQRLQMAVPDAIPAIYAGGKRLIASMAPAVFEACDAGDPIAQAILTKNAGCIARLLRTGIAFVGDPDTPLVLCGGLCHRQDLLGPAIRQHLPETANLQFTTEPMVKGAVWMARKEAERC